MKKQIQFQEQIWISTDELQVKPLINFYSKLNVILDKISFGNQVRTLCET